MNIHFTDYDIRRIAQALDNARLTSAIKENCQMLCTVAAEYYAVDARLVPWRSTHFGHPCTQWLTLSDSNVQWLMVYSSALERERIALDWTPMRETMQIIVDMAGLITSQVASGRAPTRTSRKHVTPLPNCARRSDMGLDFTHITDTRLAYRQYMCARWERQLWGSNAGLQWRSETGAPDWATDYPDIAPTLATLLAKTKTQH